MLAKCHQLHQWMFRYWFNCDGLGLHILKGFEIRNLLRGSISACIIRNEMVPNYYSWFTLAEVGFEGRPVDLCVQ